MRLFTRLLTARLTTGEDRMHVSVRVKAAKAKVVGVTG
jgi:hypothetical protein